MTINENISTLSQAEIILSGLSFLEARETNDTNKMQRLVSSCTSWELAAGIADASLIIVDFSHTDPKSTIFEHITKARNFLGSLVRTGLIDNAPVLV